MHTLPDGYGFRITCPLLDELIASAVTTDHVAEHKPNIPRLSQALHDYAKSQRTDRMYVPLPDNGQLMKDWLNNLSGYQGWRIEYLQLAHFTEIYPDRAELFLVTPHPDPVLIAARA